MEIEYVMLQNFSPNHANFYDRTTKFDRFIITIFLLNWKWIIHPRICYMTFLDSEIAFGMESLKRKMNKLYFHGILNDSK